MCLDSLERSNEREKKELRLGSLSDSIVKLLVMFFSRFVNESFYEPVHQIYYKDSIQYNDSFTFANSDSWRPVINESDQHLLHIKLAVTKMNPNKLHLSFRQVCRSVWIVDVAPTV